MIRFSSRGTEPPIVIMFLQVMQNCKKFLVVSLLLKTMQKSLSLCFLRSVAHNCIILGRSYWKELLGILMQVLLLRMLNGVNEVIRNSWCQCFAMGYLEDLKLLLSTF